MFLYKPKPANPGFATTSAKGIFQLKITRFEETRIVSARALQLSLGAPPMVKVAKEISMLDLAKKEFDEKAVPLAVIREYPGGKAEKIEVY